MARWLVGEVVRFLWACYAAGATFEAELFGDGADLTETRARRAA